MLNFTDSDLKTAAERLLELAPHPIPRLAPIVRAMCEEFGIRYNVYPNWRAALASHVRQLRLNGRTP